MPRKVLPHGNWLTMVNLPLGTTDADIQAFIHSRTGLELPAEHIQINDPIAGNNTASALISLNQAQVHEIVEWAFSEDKLGGNEVRWLSPSRWAFGCRRS